MALNIKNEEVVALVKELATRRGTDMTEAIRQAVQHELDADREAVERRIAAMHAIAERVAALPVLDPRPVEQIIDEMYEGME